MEKNKETTTFKEITNFDKIHEFQCVIEGFQDFKKTVRRKFHI